MGKVKLTIVVLGILLLSCERHEGFGPIYLNESDTVDIGVQQSKLIIGCEGNFQLGNASLSALDLISDEVQNHVFKARNEEPLGDVLQSLYHRGDTLFAVVNNSGLIRLLNDSTFEEIALIDDLLSPRHIHCEGRFMYVTDLYSNTISIFNLETLSLESEVGLEGWSEKIVRHGSNILVANITNNRVEIFDRQLVNLQTIELDFQPRYLEVLDDGIAVAGNDDPYNATRGTINVFDTDYNLVSEFELTKEIQAFSSTHKSLFAIVGEQFIEFSTPDLSPIREFDIDVQTPYSMIVNEAENEVYITDVRDFISNGRLVRYSLNDLTIIKEYEVGQIPQSMLFTLE
ncbi:MAG: hypothetical protein Salg2KO_13340 [Salibacteraceae bacterium]